ncbi:hypothetical protein EV426DRAFT_599385 [Tirmania nivea]|nr:hypothetical protein EV426DRAFT_599385 [Tirmania nivea]
MGLESTSTKGSGCGGVVTGNEKKVSRQLSSKRKSIIQVPFSGRPSISTTSRRRKSTEMLAIAGEEDSDNNDGSDDQGDIIPESSESFLQQELRPRKKARKSIVMNTNTLGMKLGGKRAEPQVGGKKPQQVQMVKSSPVLKQQHRVKQKQKQKQRHKGWSTSIYSREGRGHGYGKENHASKQGMDGSEEQVVGGSRTTVEDNACREGHPDGCGSDGHVDGGGSDEETEYAFGESVEFSSTPKVGIMVGC